MKTSELYEQVVALLEAGGCDSPAFDATCLLEDVGNLGRGNVLFRQVEELSEATCARVLNTAKRRANGEPLQYLLGTWDFLNLTLSVGEGVLIPRPETELLCQTVSDFLYQNKNGTHVTVLDLCAGSGCVGLGIASLYPNCEVREVELSPKAMVYLQKNIAAYPQYSVKAIAANVLTDCLKFEETVDVIVSNPPYIPTNDLNGLQREVKHEPAMALDGGTDGLQFYRIIADEWVNKLNLGGLVAVEVGIGQGEAVVELFKSVGLSNVNCIKDFANIDRIVIGQKL